MSMERNPYEAARGGVCGRKRERKPARLSEKPNSTDNRCFPISRLVVSEKQGEAGHKLSPG